MKMLCICVYCTYVLVLGGTLVLLTSIFLHITLSAHSQAAPHSNCYPTKHADYILNYNTLVNCTGYHDVTIPPNILGTKYITQQARRTHSRSLMLSYVFFLCMSLRY
jgi:hypothetical protein